MLVGAGGAGRALAFGAKSRGARVVIFNRKFGKYLQLSSLSYGVFALLLTSINFLKRGQRLLRKQFPVKLFQLSV